MNLSKKDKIIFCILVGFLIIAIFGITLSFKDSMIDNEIDDMNIPINTEESIKITGVKIIYDDVEYSNLEGLVDIVSAGVICECEVSYSDGSVKKKDCYVVYNTDDSVDKIIFEDNDYGKIILPKNSK